MYLHWIIFSLAFGWVSAVDNCSYMSLIQHLGLDGDNVQMKSMRPVYNWTTPTKAFVDLYVTSITDVNEKAQTISTQITYESGWISEFTKWNARDFCGIQMLSIEKDKMWIPDIVFTESVKTEFATTENPYVKLTSYGLIAKFETIAVTSACKIDLLNFPYDVQTCSLTIHSPMHPAFELTLNSYSSASFLTSSSKKAFQTQGEWELLNINMSKANASTLQYPQDQLIYTITLKRRPLLYVITFISPVFCFLVLDVASFFIDAGGGEKLSFKVTLLLSISVLLLILNDKLPSTANEVPWIGVYCITIFILIGISILETIFVNFLMAKGEQILRPEPHLDSTSAVTDTVKDFNNPSDSASDRNENQSHSLSSLKQILKKSNSVTDENRVERRCLYWTRGARMINIIFLILYIITIMVLLGIIYNAWFIK
ncbi:5-hydroxytryptamine receptor 3A-like isoform X2 [Triplophysa dalaica]|uniref:5-hydroxytryptamine receptor 3A-like isoform X2 n=1 Tax=Triplophysa dalaica TaxID=1582913 RepID=UPI0024DF71CE|nr:5-hydroxytryptamine receptor 3A-like isoform X2 [Triplophysa dalaica]